MVTPSDSEMSQSREAGKLTCFAAEDRFAGTAGSQDYLRQQQGLSAHQIAQRVMERLGE